MSKRWMDDAELVSSMAQRLVETLPLFPKRFLRVDELIRKHQMPFSHLQILIMLEECDLSIGQISARLGIAKPNITPLVDSLCEGGLTARVRDERDRRVVNVHLTAEGVKLLDRVRESVSRQVTEWSIPLSRSEAKELNAALASLLRLCKDNRADDKAAEQAAE